MEGLKSNAVKALANYLMLESAQKDQRLKQVSNQFYKNESRELNTNSGVNSSSGNSSGNSSGSSSGSGSEGNKI